MRYNSNSPETNPNQLPDTIPHRLSTIRLAFEELGRSVNSEKDALNTHASKAMFNSSFASDAHNEQPAIAQVTNELTPNQPSTKLEELGDAAKGSAVDMRQHFEDLGVPV